MSKIRERQKASGWTILAGGGWGGRTPEGTGPIVKDLGCQTMSSLKCLFHCCISSTWHCV